VFIYLQAYNVTLKAGKCNYNMFVVHIADLCCTESADMPN